MDRPLRLKINELIEKKQITPFLAMLCLSCLHEKIEYANRDYSYLEPQRDAIAKILVDNGVEKKVIADSITRIDKDCHPTMNRQIKEIYNLIILDDYKFTDEQIPENYIKFKSNEQYKTDIARTPRKKVVEKEQLEYQKLRDYVEALIGYELSKIMESKLKALKSKDYTYSLILDTFKFYDKEIDRSVSKKDIDYDGKYSYILAIVNNKLPEHFKRIKDKEKQEIERWAYNAYLVVEVGETVEELVEDIYNSEYNSESKKEISRKLLNAVNVMKKDENLLSLGRREYNDSMMRANHKPAEYKKKDMTEELEMQKQNEERFKDLW